MKHDIEKALQSIPVPDLTNEVKAGIARAERNRFTMTRSVKRIAAIAAALVLCVGIVGAAALIGRKGDSNKILTADDISLKFNGFNQNGTLNLSAEYIDSGKEVEIPYNFSSYTIIDENGEVVAVSDGDRLETKGIGLVYYWSDGDGQLYFSEIYSGKYTVIFHADNTMESTQIEGEWTIDVDLEELNYQVFFDPRNTYHGSVENGTAYVADEEEISLAFVENGDGRKRLEITVDSDAEALKDISKIYVANFVFFDENRQFLGGGGGGDFINPLIGIEGDFNFGVEFAWGDLNIRGGDVYWEDSGANLGKVCTLKIYSFAVERSDGSRIEIQGDWMVDFNV